MSGLLEAARGRLDRLAVDAQRGQGMVEYAFILVFVAMVVLVVVALLGHQVNNVFSNVSNGLGQ